MSIARFIEEKQLQALSDKIQKETGLLIQWQVLRGTTIPTKVDSVKANVEELLGRKVPVTANNSRPTVTYSNLLGDTVLRKAPNVLDIHIAKLHGIQYTQSAFDDARNSIRDLIISDPNYHGQSVISSNEDAVLYRVFYSSEWSCKEHPELNVGRPVGMYHCQLCNKLQVAGILHSNAIKDPITPFEKITENAWAALSGWEYINYSVSDSCLSKYPTALVLAEDGLNFYITYEDQIHPEVPCIDLEIHYDARRAYGKTIRQHVESVVTGCLTDLGAKYTNSIISYVPGPIDCVMIRFFEKAANEAKQ
ncbi:hypothetical protein fHeYen902_137 [Yersinia phage fHe-Yen9-02]|nr:hypothetical protein fHeYen902_137 [Yersinia phage fHe-Yen9-02]